MTTEAEGVIATIRYLHAPVDAYVVDEDGVLYPRTECKGCGGGAAWPCETLRVLEHKPDRAAPRAEGLQALVDEQAEDEGLWFNAATAPEAYLQQELRRLHAAIEGAAPRAEGPPHNPPHDARDCPECDHWIARAEGPVEQHAADHPEHHVDSNGFCDDHMAFIDQPYVLCPGCGHMVPPYEVEP